MEYGILGPLRVLDGDREIVLRRQKHRALLALLVLHAGEVVSTDRLLDELWGERPPATAKNSLQNYVSQLRKVLGANAIQTRFPGYVLDVSIDDVDVGRFQRLLDEARTQAAPERTATLRRALALWRGRALADVQFEPFALAEAPRLEELRATAEEELVAAELDLGRHTELVSQLERLVAREPLRERRRAQLMLALYRSGRQADALAAYQDARKTLVEELGIEPGPSLRALEQAILRQDPALAAPELRPTPAEPRPADLRERRATVTVLFAEVAVRGELDAERHRALITRAFHEMRAATEYHGGFVDRLAGDELIAVFGVPERHEDDAVRAVRAALQIQRTVSGTSDLEGRIALETGEVIAPGPAARAPVVGPPVTLAKRLAEAVPPGEVVAGARTVQLLRGIARTETLEPVSVRGRTDPVAVFRIMDLHETARPPRVAQTPLVGRAEELAVLREMFDGIAASRRSSVFTVLGEAGVGKTRLAVELAEAIGSEAQVVVGRCVSYGEGATWLPLREIAQQARLDALDETVAVTLAQLLRSGDVPTADALWAVRRLVEALAAEQPALIVLDDLHWAAPTFLDFVEQLANTPADAPALVLCLARPELADDRPTLRSLRLEPLSEAQSKRLVDAAAEEGVPQQARARIADVAGGNPLFAEQLLAYVREHGLDALALVPPTVDALLASRLDRLDAEELGALQRAAVIGREFWHAALLSLTPSLEVPAVGRHLVELARKGLIRAVQSSSDREDAFRFHHVLIRDVAYASIPKAERASLHEGVAEWLDTEYDAADEVVGYHLEQAYLLRAEAGVLDRHTRLLAQDAGARLAAAGIRAWKRADAPAASNLISRAVVLLPDSDPDRAELLCELGVALSYSGDRERGEASFREALELAGARGDRRLEFRARVELAGSHLFGQPEGRSNELVELAAKAIPVFEEFGDDRALGRVWLQVGYVHGGFHVQNGAWQEAAERALVHYSRAGWPTSLCRQEIAAAIYHGPTPVREGIGRCRALVEGADHIGEANVLVVLGGLEAMRGRAGIGRALVGQARAVFEELGLMQALASSTLWMEGEIALLKREYVHAETCFRESCDFLKSSGDSAHLATFAAQLSESLYAQGRLDEAMEWTEVSEAHAASDDVGAQFAWRSVRAKLHARRGFMEKAMSLANQALELVEETDAVNQRAKLLLDRAEVLRLAGHHGDAAASAERALHLFESKGNTAAARQVRTRLNELALA